VVGLRLRAAGREVSEIPGLAQRREPNLAPLLGASQGCVLGLVLPKIRGHPRLVQRDVIHAIAILAVTVGPDQPGR
jgi:hypothetical protein